MLEQSLRKITRDTEKLHGCELLEKYCQLFNTILNAQYTYIVEVGKSCIGGINIFHSKNNEDIFKELFIYSIKNKPCEVIIKNEKPLVIQGNLKESYPNIKIFHEQNINSYVGVPVFNKNNECCAILISLFLQANIPQNTQMIMELFAPRISSELDLMHQNNVIEEQYYLDPLTQMPNRAAFSETLKKIKRNNNYNSVIFIDVDYFKMINESLGHFIGDMILKKVSEELRLFSDEDCEAFRMGSDEFAILIFSDSKDKESSTVKAEEIASKLINHFNKPIKVDFHELLINFSVGIYTFTHLSSIHDIIRYADISLYQAKSSGHNTIRRYTEDMKENGQRKLLLKNELVKAIQNDDLDIHLQPQVNNNRLLYGAESLVRWEYNGSFISPVDFIPLAEETGLIKLIGDQVLYKTCDFFEKNLNRLPKSFRKFSINVSPIQFYQPNFVEDFIAIFEKFDIPPSRMEIEITENVFFKERHESIKKMYQLLEYGFSFAVDDFGTGYSSLSYLIDLPFNKLKIDQAFIKRISESDRYKKLVESIINICNHMNFYVIAEGIENQEDFEFLKENGCKYYQGFYFSKPLSRKDFCESQLLKERRA